MIPDCFDELIGQVNGNWGVVNQNPSQLTAKDETWPYPTLLPARRPADYKTSCNKPDLTNTKEASD